jgi:iron complex outermembrane recepter protein
MWLCNLELLNESIMQCRQSAAISAAISLCLFPSYACAADSPTTLDEVKVTASATRLAKRSKAASRLDLSVRELPLSIDVIDQESLRLKGENTLGEALDNAPGIVAGYSFGVLNIAGRGFSGVFNSPILYDGIRYPGWQISPRLSLNYQQIEILRGPAAMTAGQGSIAGAVNLVSRRASGERELRAFSALGRFATQTYGLGAGGKLGELNARVDLSYQGSNQRGSFGFARDTSFEFFHINSELAAPISDQLLLSLSLEAFEDNAEGYFGTPLIAGRLEERLREVNYNITDDYINMSSYWLRARMEWRPNDAVALRGVLFANAEDRDWRNTEAYSYQPATTLIRRNDYLQITHEQAIRGALFDATVTQELFGLPHQWVIGVQRDRNDHDRFSDSPFRFTDSVPLLPTDRGSFRSLDPLGLRTATIIDQSSAYLDSALDLSSRFKLLSGYRFDRSQVDSRNALSGARFDKKYQASSYRIGGSYALQSVSFYGAWSTSFEAPAQITTLGLANAPFDLTDSEQFEIGAKIDADWGNATFAIYDLARSNILSRDPADANRLIQIGKQAAQGVEASLGWQINDKWTLEGNASVLDAEFENFLERVGSTLVSRAGKRPTAVPERSATVWVHWQASDTLGLSLGARGVGSSFADNANTIVLPGYGTLDANIRLDTDYGRFGFRLRNLADRYYATRPYNAGNQVMTGEPRWFELSWQRRFF